MRRGSGGMATTPPCSVTWDGVLQLAGLAGAIGLPRGSTMLTTSTQSRDAKKAKNPTGVKLATASTSAAQPSHRGSTLVRTPTSPLAKSNVTMPPGA